MKTDELKEGIDRLAIKLETGWRSEPITKHADCSNRCCLDTNGNAVPRKDEAK